MESKLNYESIEAYAEQYTRIVLGSLTSERVSGMQIVELKGVKQVNLLVIKNLFEKWSHESAKLRSPYFDYETDEVRLAMEAYMNALSRHISIQSQDFAPLLKQAVVESILLIFSPFNFYSRELKSVQRQTVLLKDLKSLQRYIKVNRHPMDALVKAIEALGREELPSEEAFEVFNQVCGKLNESPEDIHPYLEKFHQISELKTSMIYLEEELKGTKAISGEEDSPREIPSAQSNIQEIKEEKQSINEKLASPREPETLLDKLNQSTSRVSIKKNIGLNQRIMFTKELFGGKQELFNAALDKIDELSSYQEALKHIMEDFAKVGNWNLESDEVMEFMELVERKFK